MEPWLWQCISFIWQSRYVCMICKNHYYYEGGVPDHSEVGLQNITKNATCKPSLAWWPLELLSVCVCVCVCVFSMGKTLQPYLYFVCTHAWNSSYTISVKLLEVVCLSFQKCIRCPPRQQCSMMLLACPAQHYSPQLNSGRSNLHSLTVVVWTWLALYQAWLDLPCCCFSYVHIVAEIIAALKGFRLYSEAYTLSRLEQINNLRPG